jgi:hypothetical protein
MKAWEFKIETSYAIIPRRTRENGNNTHVHSYKYYNYGNILYLYSSFILFISISAKENSEYWLFDCKRFVSNLNVYLSIIYTIPYWFRPSYCFYLSSHRDRCSTLQARQFLVLFDNTDLSAQKIQRLILYLTLYIPQRNQFFLPFICRVNFSFSFWS